MPHRLELESKTESELLKQMSNCSTFCAPFFLFFIFFWVFIYFSMCASPVVLLLSFVFFCCGSLTVRFRVSVKYFRLAPDEATPSSTSQLESASLFQVYRFVSPASEREKGNELERAREKEGDSKGARHKELQVLSNHMGKHDMCHVWPRYMPGEMSSLLGRVQFKQYKCSC